MQSIKDSNIVFNCVHLLHSKCHKINPNCGGSYIDSPDWIKNKEAKISPINKNCLEEIKKDLRRITKIISLRNKCIWKEINSQSEKDDWKNFEKNNGAIPFNNFKRRKRFSCSKKTISITKRSNF